MTSRTAARTKPRSVALPVTLAPLPGEPRNSRVKVVSRGRRARVLSVGRDGRLQARRPRTHEEREAASVFQGVRAVIEDPAFWAVANTLPGNARIAGSPGRPPAHPTWVFLLVAATTALTGTQRSAITFFADPAIWEFIRRYTADFLPAGFDPAGASPPKRHHLMHHHAKWSSGAWDECVADAKATLTAEAVAAATAQGLLDPAKPLRYDHADPAQFIAYDGTIFRPASKSRPVMNKDKAAARRVDPAAGWHTSGAHKQRVWGAKVVFASVRSDAYHGRYILDFEQVTGPTKTGVGDEAAATITSATRLKPALPGAHGVICDGALHGKHLSQLADIGLVTINYPTAKRNPNRAKGGRNAPGRVGKQHKVRTHTHLLPNGRECVHEVFANDSVLYQSGFDDEGRTIKVEVPVVGYDKRANRTGTWRYYLKVRIGCPYGDQTIAIPLYHDDTTPGGLRFNRGEYLRFYPTNTPQFDILYGRRNDTESLHNQLKVKMRKMPAYGQRRQRLYLIGLVIAHNALTRAHALRDAGLPNPLDHTQ